MMSTTAEVFNKRTKCQNWQCDIKEVTEDDEFDELIVWQGKGKYADSDSDQNNQSHKKSH